MSCPVLKQNAFYIWDIGSPDLNGVSYDRMESTQNTHPAMSKSGKSDRHVLAFSKPMDEVLSKVGFFDVEDPMHRAYQNMLQCVQSFRLLRPGHRIYEGICLKMSETVKIK